MKSIVTFLKLVEIQTKIASIFPFVLGNLFALYRYNTFSIRNMMIMFISLLCIDMATTTINNYYDYKKAIKKYGYGYETHNAIVKYNIKDQSVVIIILLLLAVATISGLYLVYLTDFVVLIIGAISFGVGLLYSSGPIPISRTPFGEITSGIFMGCFITFLGVYIHIYDDHLITLSLINDALILTVNWLEVLVIILVSSPMVLGISNIMLANNICDADDDYQNKRYTLPIYIGIKRALLIYKWSYRLIIITVVALILLDIISIFSLLSLLILIPIEKMTRTFLQNQEKAVTFVNAVKSFTLIGLSMNLLLIIHIVFRLN